MQIDNSDLEAFVRYAARERALDLDQADRRRRGLPALPEAYARFRHRNRLMLYAATRRQHAGYRMRVRRPGRATGPIATPVPLLEVIFELDGRTATFTIGRN